MTEVSASRRAAVVVVAGFAFLLMVNIGLMHKPLDKTQFGALIIAYASATGATLAGLWLVQRWWMRGSKPLIVQLDEAGKGRIAQRVQDGPAEWADISRAINVAFARIRAQLDDRDDRLGELHAEISVDAVTGLSTSAQFMGRLDSVLHGFERAAVGGLAVLRVDDLIGLNQRFGRERADELLKRISTLLRTRVMRLDPHAAMVGRLGGADFAVLVSEAHPEALDTWMAELTMALHGLKQRKLTDRPRVGWLVATNFQAADTPETVMSRVESGLQSIECKDIAWLRVGAVQSRRWVSLPQWRTLIDESLMTGRLELKFQSVLTGDGLVQHQMAQAQIAHLDGWRVEPEELLQAALRTERMADIDLRVIELALAHIAGHDADVVVHVSLRSAERPSFVKRVNEILTAAGLLARRLWVEFEIDGERHLSAVAEPLTAMLQRHGVHIGVRRVTGLPDDFELLRSLAVTHLRLSASLSQDLLGVGRIGRRRLLQLLVELGAAEGLGVFAAEAGQDADAQFLRQQGIPCADAAKDSRSI